MGLDSVELLVAVEKTFDIEIADRDAEKIATVGDFYDAVWDKIKESESNKCKSMMLYYKFRRFFQERYGITRQDFKPEKVLDTIIPKEKRILEWQSIQQDFQYKLPKLGLPIWLNRLLFFFGAITIVGGLVIALVAVNYWDASYIWWLIPVAGLVLTILLSYASQPLKTAIKQKDVRELVESVLALNYKQLSNLFGTNRQEMERVMTLIIQDRTGVEFSEIKPEAYITKDLGID